MSTDKHNTATVVTEEACFNYVDVREILEENYFLRVIVCTDEVRSHHLIPKHLVEYVSWTKAPTPRRDL